LHIIIIIINIGCLLLIQLGEMYRHCRHACSTKQVANVTRRPKKSSRWANYSTIFNY